MRLELVIILLAGLVCGLFTTVKAQSLQDIIRTEQSSRAALNQYSFKRDVVLETLDPSGQVNGTYVRDSEFVFKDNGERVEKVLHKSSSTLKGLQITDEDIYDLQAGQMFGIDNPDKYDLIPNERGWVEVRPKIGSDSKRMNDRYFAGYVRVDPAGQIRLVRGRVGPEIGKQRFPWFETHREPVDGHVFPARTEADDMIHFPEYDVRYRVKVRYYDYKRFKSDVVIKDLEEVSPETISKGGPLTGLPRWPEGSTVKVYTTKQFTFEQIAAIKRGVESWNELGVTFQYAGETEEKLTCSFCLTVYTGKVANKDHYAVISGETTENGIRTFAWITLNEKTVDPKAMESFTAHETGHGLGLTNCSSCKSVMKGFSKGPNKGNGYVRPSQADKEALRQQLVSNP